MTPRCVGHQGHYHDEDEAWPATVEGIRAPPCTLLQLVMNQNNNGNENTKEGGIGTPAMTLDLGYREEDVEFLVSATTDDGKDLNPHGRSLPERVALKIMNRLLRIGIWNVRTLYPAWEIEKHFEGNR